MSRAPSVSSSSLLGMSPAALSRKCAQPRDRQRGLWKGGPPTCVHGTAKLGHPTVTRLKLCGLWQRGWRTWSHLTRSVREQSLVFITGTKRQTDHTSSCIFIYCVCCCWVRPLHLLFCLNPSLLNSVSRPEILCTKEHSTVRVLEGIICFIRRCVCWICGCQWWSQHHPGTFRFHPKWDGQERSPIVKSTCASFRWHWDTTWRRALDM